MFALCENRTRDLLRSRRIFPPLRQIGRQLAEKIKISVYKNMYVNKQYLNIIIIYLNISLVWCPGQNKRIAPLSFLHGCSKRRLKD
jgi:hypothetical protein